MKNNWIRFLAGALVSVMLVGAFALTGGMKGGKSTEGLLYQASGLHPDGEMLVVSIAACLSGAVCGDHCSPISDTTIMSSAGAQVEHVNHVATQLPYAITVACLSFVCFVLAGFIQNWIVCLAIGVVLTVGTLFAIRNVEAQKARIKD